MYNPLKSEVAIYNAVNFPKQVGNNREKGISIVQFYKSGEQSSTKDKGQWEKFAIENKGMFRIGSVDCNEFSKICEKEGVTEFPTYRVYPPTPVPAFNAEQDRSQEVNTDALKKQAYKFIGNRVIEINSNNIDTFVNDNPGKPKMLLFTETKSAPMVYRALSTYFDKTLEFGMVKKDDEALLKKYKITKFPSFVLLKNNEKPIHYTGSSYTYSELFEFINIYSETFVFVGDQEQKEVKSAATNPWLNMATPFLTKDSANDICLQKDGTLCVIFVANGNEKTNEINEVFNQVKMAFMSKIERGITFNFMRIDAEKEPEFAGLFTENPAEPMIAIMNPGKRKRFLAHEGDVMSA
jgi:hypothetical protein